MDLPSFRCHPDPVGTGFVAPSDAACPSCGLARGHAYTGPVYAIEEIDGLCPWCIADGSADEKFGASFTDVGDEVPDGVSMDVLREVSGRAGLRRVTARALALSRRRRRRISRLHGSQGARALSGRACGTTAQARRVRLVGG
jgi:hypothetical protein